MPFEGAFTIRAYNALTGLAEEHMSLRFCQRCRRPFVAKREDSVMCSGSCRTLAWRAENPEAFRAYRRQYYRRKQGQQARWEPDTAQPLKIQTGKQARIRSKRAQ